MTLMMGALLVELDGLLRRLLFSVLAAGLLLLVTPSIAIAQVHEHQMKTVLPWCAASRASAISNTKRQAVAYH